MLIALLLVLVSACSEVVEVGSEADAGEGGMEERYSSTNSQVDPILTSRGSLRSTFIPIPNNNESARAMHLD